MTVLAIILVLGLTITSIQAMQRVDPNYPFYMSHWRPWVYRARSAWYCAKFRMSDKLTGIQQYQVLALCKLGKLKTENVPRRNRFWWVKPEELDPSILEYVTYIEGDTCTLQQDYFIWESQYRVICYDPEDNVVTTTRRAATLDPSVDNETRGNPDYYLPDITMWPINFGGSGLSVSIVTRFFTMILVTVTRLFQS